MERVKEIIKGLKDNNITFTEFDNGIVIKGDCVEVIKYISKVDHILIDPPYQYLKHEIEEPFDYALLFKEFARITYDDSGLVCFGRGDEFFKWNLSLADNGFKHKEDCTMIKKQSPISLSGLKRHGEYYTIRGNKYFTVKTVMIPTFDKENITDAQIVDWHRRAFNNNKEKREEVLNYLISGKKEFNTNKDSKEQVTQVKGVKTVCDQVSFTKNLIEGVVMSNTLYTARESLRKGWTHPTIKPSSALGYIIEAISKENDLILDCFLGSGSTAIACINKDRFFIGIEKLDKYYKLSCERIAAYERELYYK